MDSNTITCANCGATCKAKDEYCKSCWKRLSIETEQDDPIKDDMSQSEWVDWELFIDKKADRYIEIYKENYDKKIFPHMNWSAFFFGLNWVLYRKMTKVAVIGYLIGALLSISLIAILFLPHRAEIKTLMESTDSFASLELAEIAAEVQLKSFFIIPFNCVFWGLFGDAIYKMHIEKNIKRNNGGTSVAELMGGRIIFSIIEALALNPVTTLISLILIS